MSIKRICKAKEKETWEVFSITVGNIWVHYVSLTNIIRTCVNAMQDEAVERMLLSIIHCILFTAQL